MISTSAKTAWLLVLLAGSSPALGSPDAEQLPIARVERMPNLPHPYQMRDWRKVTQDYLDFLASTECRGEHLPLMAWSVTGQPRIRLPSYVGGPGGPEGINFLVAIVSGGLVGKDMQHFRGHDWVALSTNYFSAKDGVCGNGWGGGSGLTFWQETPDHSSLSIICKDQRPSPIRIHPATRSDCHPPARRKLPAVIPDWLHYGLQ